MFEPQVLVRSAMVQKMSWKIYLSIHFYRIIIMCRFESEEGGKSMVINIHDTVTGYNDFNGGSARLFG